MTGAGFDREFYGLASHRGRWSETSLKGSLIRSRRRYLDRHAPRAIDAIRAELGPAAREYLDADVLVSARLPYSPLVELDSAIVRHAMGGRVELMLEFAHEIATHDLDGGMYRSLLRMIGGPLSLRVYATAYQSYWHPGQVSSASESRGSVVTLQGVIMPRYMCRYGFTGYIERLLEIANVPSRVAHECCHEGAHACRWVVSAA